MSLKNPDNRFLRLTTSQQSRNLDQSTIEKFGIDSITLMEIAGEKAAGIIRDHTKVGSNGLYVCGKGNNAGDALVAARYLSETARHSVSILLAAGNDDLSTDTQKNFRLLKTLAEHGSEVTFLTDTDSISWNGFDYAVDGMIGTGLTSDLRRPMSDLVDELNRSGLQTFSMDIPTGLNCDTGEILGTCVLADQTITFGTNKIGFYMGDGPSVTGGITLAHLPFPDYLRQHKAMLVNKELPYEFDNQTSVAPHKYAKGTVHIVAGSEGMTGAAIMAAKSAWNAGAGAVILHSPRGLLPIYEQTLPEIIKNPVGGNDDIHFTGMHASAILEKISEKKGVVLIGPGLGLAETSQDCILKLLETLDQPVILDADGLTVWTESLNIEMRNWLLTPHPGELNRYLGVSVSSDLDRLSGIEKLSRETGCRILSKGYPAIMATPESGTFITGYDTRLFSRAGFGDVLAGTIAGKLSVSRKTDQSITDALISIFLKAETIHEPKPDDIYDR